MKIKTPKGHRKREVDRSPLAPGEKELLERMNRKLQARVKEKQIQNR